MKWVEAVILIMVFIVLVFGVITLREILMKRFNKEDKKE